MITSVLVINNSIIIAWGNIPAAVPNQTVRITLPITFPTYYKIPCPNLFYGDGLTGAAAYYLAAIRRINLTQFECAGLAYFREYIAIGF